MILLAKITPPVVPDWAVPRDRISKLIAASTPAPLTLLTGPPGAGKTMAVAMWTDSAAASSDAIAWVNLDEYDSHPRVFWTYVLAALQQADVTMPKVLSAMVRESEIGHEFLLRFASAMASMDSPATLVLDDLHLLTDPAVLAGLGYVLRNAGPYLHVVATSRIDPLLPLHRYRLSGELTEIRASDLAFTIAETRLVMAHHGTTLSEDSLEYLVERTEGWAAGVRLAALSMAGHDDPDQFVKMFVTEDSSVTSYLVNEILDAQPDRLRRLLLRTSILDRVNEELARELAGGPATADALPRLAEANAFVTPAGHGWYRYNSLFRSVLCLKLRHEDPDLVPGLHRRASAWYRRNGYLARAVRHAAEAGDWPLAATIVVDELAVGRLIDPAGTSEHLADTFGGMPPEVARMHPQCLIVDAAIELSRGKDEQCGGLATAETLLDRLPDQAQITSRLAIALIRLTIAKRAGDMDGAASAVAEAELLLAAVPDDRLTQHPDLRLQVLYGRGAVEFWAGKLDSAAAALEEGTTVTSGPDAENLRADCVGKLALVEALSGRLNHAAELAADAVVLTDSESDRQPGTASPAAEVALACVHVERNELSLAADRLRRADDALRIRPNKLISAVACLIAGRHQLAEGRAAAALELAGRARKDWTTPRWLERRLKMLESRAYAATSDGRAAAAAAGGAGAEAEPDAAVALAYARLAGGDRRAARQALSAVPPDAGTPADIRLENWLVDAQLSYGNGDRSRGRRALEHAMQLAEPEQLRLPFALQRTWLTAVLRHEPSLADAHRQLLAPDGVTQVSRQTRPRAAERPASEVAMPLIVERLSTRESEVLQYMAEMLSTAEIASRMYISVNTVKTHVKSIYRKLAASHRGEAVRRARQLGLLTGPVPDPPEAVSLCS